MSVLGDSVRDKEVKNFDLNRYLEHKQSLCNRLHYLCLELFTKTQPRTGENEAPLRTMVYLFRPVGRPPTVVSLFPELSGSVESTLGSVHLHRQDLVGRSRSSWWVGWVSQYSLLCTNNKIRTFKTSPTNAGSLLLLLEDRSVRLLQSVHLYKKEDRSQKNPVNINQSVVSNHDFPLSNQLLTFRYRSPIVSINPRHLRRFSGTLSKSFH